MLHYNLSTLQRILNAVNLRRSSNPYPVTTCTLTQVDTICHTWFSKNYLPKDVEKYLKYRYGSGLAISIIARSLGVTELKVTRGINSFIRKMDWVLEEIMVCPRGILSIFPEVACQSRVCKAIFNNGIRTVDDLALFNVDDIIYAKGSGLKKSDKNEIKRLHGLSCKIHTGYVMR